MFSVWECRGLYVNIGTWIFFAYGYYFILPQILTDGHGFLPWGWVCFEHEICRRPTDQREVISRISIFFGTRMNTDGHGFYRADGIFEHELHEFNEYFFAHEWTRILPCGGLHYLFSHRCQMNTDLESLKWVLTKTIKTPNCIFRKPSALHCLP